MKNYMEHKGYMGKISYSQEDHVFFGTVVGINDLITFEGDSADALASAFKEAVDDYLEICKRNAKQPDKSFRGQFNVRIDPELHRKIASESEVLDISLNQFVEVALRKYAEGEWEKSDAMPKRRKSG